MWASTDRLVIETVARALANRDAMIAHFQPGDRSPVAEGKWVVTKPEAQASSRHAPIHNMNSSAEYRRKRRKDKLDLLSQSEQNHLAGTILAAASQVLEPMLFGS